MTIMFRDMVPMLKVTTQQALKPVCRNGTRLAAIWLRPDLVPAFREFGSEAGTQKQRKWRTTYTKYGHTLQKSQEVPRPKTGGNSSRSEDQQGGLILLSIELREGWGPPKQEKVSSSDGSVWPYFQGTLTLTLFLCATITNKHGNSRPPFLSSKTWHFIAIVQRIESSWYSWVPGGLSLHFQVNVQVLTSLGLRFPNNKTEHKMTQTHCVSFRPTSFPQPLSEMSGPAPQGMRSWGNGVRTEGAEQQERDGEGGLREWMRLWEQSREGSQPSTLLPLWWPLSPSLPSLLLPR